MEHATSKRLYGQALGLMPGGVSSPVRAMRSIGREPIFMARGEGPFLVDVDGNRYVDYVCSWGPLIHGHANEAVVASIEAAARHGTSFGASSPGEVELAREVVSRVPGAERVRFTNSGTEAAMTAIRLARAATGKELVVKFAGAYHGHVDGLLASAGSGLMTHGVPSSPGVLRAQAEATIVIPWNDPEALDRVIDRHGQSIAAVIAEPIPANMGVVPGADGFVSHLRRAADASGALLILDEVISGFRVARGGAQELLGVGADIVLLGKVLGGGLPLAALAGPRHLMAQLAPEGEVYQAGTLSGNPLACAAGTETLRLLDADAYGRLGETTDVLAQGLDDAADCARDAGVGVDVSRVCGLVTVFFTDRAVRDYEGAMRCDASAYAAFCRAMLDMGVYPPPSQFEAWFPSLAHEPAHVERTLEAARHAFSAVTARR